jgi:hypothetical protein
MRSGAGPTPDELLFPAQGALACGHSHIPWIAEKDGRLALNPGSVGENLSEDGLAHYALLEWDGRWQAELRAMPYDMARLEEAFEQSSYLEEGGAFARACLLTTLSGRNVAWAFISLGLRLARQRGCPNGQVPDGVFRKAEASFDWGAAAPAESWPRSHVGDAG